MMTRKARSGKEGKRKGAISKSAYLRLLTDECTWPVPHKPYPIIFINDLVPQTNIRDLYSSVTLGSSVFQMNKCVSIIMV
jgi:hypothetical protein